jgi:hypothetical protein
MSWRIRRSIKIAPGVQWNVGKKSSSFSLGPRGLKLTVGTKGTRTTVGLPGTGVSYTEFHHTWQSSGTHPMIPAEPAIPDVAIDPSRFGIGPRWVRLGLVSSAILLGVAGLGGQSLLLLGLALVLGLSGMVLPSRARLAQREFERRRTLFQKLANEAITNVDRQQLATLSKLQKQLGLQSPEIALELEQVEAITRLLVLKDAEKSSGLPVVNDVESSRSVDTCYFAADAHLVNRGLDASGRLLLTKAGCLFVGVSRIEVPWSKIASLTMEQRDLVVQRHDRQNPERFRMATFADTLCAHHVAAALRGSLQPVW